MQKLTTTLSGFAKFLATGTLALVAAQAACAEVYDFNRFQYGGGGGTLPDKQRIVTTAGAGLCVDISEGRGATSRVLFTFWNQIPQLKSRIGEIAFDTGRHKSLFSSMSILTQSPGLKPSIQRQFSHAFLPGIAGDYAVLLPWPDGITPGKSVVVAATLAPGKTYADFKSALREGLTPSTATKGFRIGVIASHILGGPPRGVATINDDGGFALTSAPTRCRAR